MTDETGTLTQAEMTVVQVWAGGVRHAVSGVGYAPIGDVAEAQPVRGSLRAALCCNSRMAPPPADTGRYPQPEPHR